MRRRLRKVSCLSSAAGSSKYAIAAHTRKLVSEDVPTKFSQAVTASISLSAGEARSAIALRMRLKAIAILVVTGFEIVRNAADVSSHSTADRDLDADIGTEFWLGDTIPMKPMYG